MNSFVQISDCHIDDQAESMGVNTHTNLKKVVQMISKKNPSTVLISGDLTHNGTQRSYQHLKKILQPIQSKLVIIAGNHDNIYNLKKAFAPHLKPKFTLGNWEIITLDSVQPSKISGFLSPKTLTELTQTLSKTHAKYNIVVLHHPIVSMQSSWDDNLSLENANELFNVLDKYPKIKAVLWGHAHQATEFSRNQVKLIACPSTAQQFNNESRIGFNHYRLYDDGKLEYQTQWIT